VHRATNKEGIPATRRACGNCGRLGHLTRTCTRSTKAHDKIGVEVEGWWRNENWAEVERVASNWHMAGTEDGSLNGYRNHTAYEFRTRPGSLGEQISQVIAVYPDAYHASAGMHVHMSFKSAQDITCLNSTEFFRYFRERWESWGTRMQVNPDSQFWKRLKGYNDYCDVNTVADTSTMLGGDRYKQLNFTSYARHKTMEMRMLPLFRDARLAVSALEEWVTIVEDFLDLVAPSQVWAKYDRDTTVDLSDGGVYEQLQTIDLHTTAESDAREMTVDLAHHEFPPANHWDRTVCIESNRVITLETDAPIVQERTDSVDLPAILPCTPGHVRLHGRAARNIETALTTYAPRTLGA
jgi:hypothetical protein